MLTLPTTLNDRYCLVEQLGAGGLADVYRATDLVLEREVAVKVVRGATADDDQPFAKEIAALARLSHPGIIRLYDGGTHESIAYLVMEFVDGTPLDALIAAEAPLDEARVRLIGREVAEALAHAHDVGLVHRDVKPANILIDGDGRTRLTDFGIARVIDETLTSNNVGLGTAGYLAPEQVESGIVGPSADVYSLGLVLLECLTGERAFPGTLTESTIARLHRDPPVPSTLGHQWRRLLADMTHREPDERPSARTVAARLGRGGLRVVGRGLLHGSGLREAVGHALPHGLARQGAGTNGRSATPVDGQAPAVDPEQRRWRLAAHAPRWVLALAAALLVLAIVLVGNQPVEDPADPSAVPDAAIEQPAEDEEPPEDLEDALDRLDRAVRR